LWRGFGRDIVNAGKSNKSKQYALRRPTQRCLAVAGSGDGWDQFVD
jgi:hypothetical protein